MISLQELRQAVASAPTPTGPIRELRGLIENGRFTSVTPEPAVLPREQVQAHLDTFGCGDIA